MGVLLMADIGEVKHMGCYNERPHSDHFWPTGALEQYYCVGVSLEQVNHPDHYNSHPSGVECIDIVRHMNFNLGNVVKYVWRAGMKESAPTIQDLEKAAWYLADEIEQRKKEDGE